MPGWRSIVIGTGARLSVRHAQLHVVTDAGETSVPLEDLDSVMLESYRITASCAVLAEMAQRGIAVFVCDRKHMPCGVLLSFNRHHRSAEIVQAQFSTTLPFRKRCWQAIVRQKIRNQAACLDILGRDGGENLRHIASSVVSGDSTGREAYAARCYFAAIDPAFRRHSDRPLSSALDYGYAVVRALLARYLAVQGLVLSEGVGHANRLNRFNLADDFLEPFRPMVDTVVFSEPPGDELTPTYRARLAGVVHHECEMDDGTYTLSTAAEAVAESYARACQHRDYRLLRLPILSAQTTLRMYE
ncbi:MAG: type II CRISPR-associated endonuclease Cas1 [Coriobacteriia bacterium]